LAAVNEKIKNMTCESYKKYKDSKQLAKKKETSFLGLRNINGKNWEGESRTNL